MANQSLRIGLAGVGNYEARLLRHLKRELENLGAQCCLMLDEHPAKFYTGEEMQQFIKDNNVSVMLTINAFRSNYSGVPENVRWISWVQDARKHTRLVTDECMRDGDICYTLCSPKILNVTLNDKYFNSTLYTGVSDEFGKMYGAASAYICDFSIIGYIPPMYRLPVGKTLPFSASAIKAFKLANKFVPQDEKLRIRTSRFLSNNLYTPLKGEVGEGKYEAAVTELFASVGLDVEREDISSQIKDIVLEYPRYADRMRLMDILMKITDNMRFYGLGWSAYPKARRYWHGVLEREADLDAAFRLSRINVHTNPNGFGVHSRTLESMAAGGFVMAHRGPCDELPGGILHEFEENTHFMFYDSEAPEEDFRRALRDEKARMACVRNAHELVKQKHRWINRAETILNDLAKV